MTDGLLRVLFVNENVAGHATVHHHLRATIGPAVGIQPTFLDVPARGPLRRALGAAIPGLARLDLDLQPLRAQLALSAWVRRRLPSLLAEADVVHLYTQNAGLLSASWLASRPAVVSLDTTNAHNAYRLPYRRPTRATPLTVALTAPFERRVFRAATTIVANSAWAAASVRDDYGVEPDRVRELPFGVVAPSFPEAAAPGTVRSGRPRITFVGHQLDRKGALRLVDVHQRYLATRADLVLVTTEAIDPPPGVQVIDDVRPGSPRLWEVLRESSVFAFPSPIDQAPNAVLEAMAAGLPVVACAVAAVPEMILDGIGGRLVAPGDDLALRDALASLLDDACARRAMGTANRRRFEERYDAVRIAPALAAVLTEAVDSHAQRRMSQSGAR